MKDRNGGRHETITILHNTAYSQKSRARSLYYFMNDTTDTIPKSK